MPISYITSDHSWETSYFTCENYS